ncbi:carbohydrate kinase family protein [Candidatus Woesearchaeota archaeon]|nr:carbohydrate kinase family protein [Candidatus Woesearchaeota archaeon]
MMYDVITMGSNTVDLFVHTDRSEIIDIRSKEGSEEFISYPVGSKMLITKFMQDFGGNGANTAVAFARLGLKTAYLGEIGKDHYGSLILKALQKEKIGFIGTRGDASGISIILDSIEDDRTILVYKGCNNDLRLKDISLKKLNAKWLYLTSMLGESLITMKAVAAHAKKNNIKIAFNPSATLLENECKSALELLSFTDVLVLNKEEAEALAGKNSQEENIQKLLSHGPKVIAITDGKNGAVAYNDGYYYKIGVNKEVKVVETTGAGDAFASTMTAGIIMGKPFEDCLKMAIINAESEISRHGAQNLLLSRRQMMEQLSKDKRPVEKKKVEWHVNAEMANPER